MKVILEPKGLDAYSQHQGVIKIFIFFHLNYQKNKLHENIQEIVEENRF